jgi:hypothetical protein
MMNAMASPPPCPQCGGQLVPMPSGNAPLGPSSTNTSIPDPFASLGAGANPLGPSNPWQANNAFAPQSGGGFGQPMAPTKPSGGISGLMLVGIGGAVLMGLVLVVGVIAFASRSRRPVAEAPPPPPVAPMPAVNPATLPLPAAPANDSAAPGGNLASPNSTPPAFPPLFPQAPRNQTDSPSTPADSTPTSTAETPASPPPNLGKLKPASGSERLGNARDLENSFEPRVPWSVQPDGFELEWPVAEKPLAIAVETSESQTRVVFPERPSYFAAVGLNEFRNKQVRIYDLRTGKAVNKFPGEFDHDRHNTALSSDGKYIATVVQSPLRILVANTKTGKVAQEIELGTTRRVDRLIFAGDTQLVAVVGDFSKSFAGVWDVEAGETLAEFELETPRDDGFSTRRYQSHTLTASPGGKYFAVMVGEVISVYEAANGQLAGETILSGGHYSSAELAFSSRGDELLVLHGSPGEIVRISMNDGEVTGRVNIVPGEFERVSGGHRAVALQELPNMGCYLIRGKLVVDADSGNAVFGVNAFQESCRTLPGGRIVGLLHNRQAKGSTLGEFRLPRAEIEKLAGVLRGGGTLFDSLLGEAKVGDLSDAEVISHPPREITWNMEIDLAPSPGVRKPLVLPKAERYTYTGSHEFILNPAGSHFAWLPTLGDAHSRLWVANGNSGKLEGDIEVLPKSRAVDISPDGSLALVAITADHYSRYSGLQARRLEVYSIPQKKHVFAWRMEPEPSVGREDRPSFTTNAASNRFSKAYFIEKNFVLTQLEGGRIVGWTLPDAKAKYEFRTDAKIAGFSPGRKYVLLQFSNERRLCWMDAKTGKWCGQWAYEGFQPAVAFSPTAEKVICVSPDNGYTRIVVHSATTGDLLDEFIVPPVATLSEKIAWNDERFVIIDRIVFDLESGAPVWQIHFSGDPLIPASGKAWVIDRTAQNAVAMYPAEIPSKSLRERFAKSNAKPVAPIIGPGTKVSVHVGSLAGGINPADAYKALSEQVTKRGWTVDANAPFRLFASSAESSGGTVEYRGSGRTESVNVRQVKTTYVISDTSGREVWKREFTAQTSTPFSVVLQEGKSVQQMLNESFDNTLKHSVDGGSLPVLVYPDGIYQRLPTTRISVKGEEMK